MQRQERVILDSNTASFEIKSNSTNRFRKYGEISASRLLNNIVTMGAGSSSTIQLLPQNTRLHIATKIKEVFVTEYPPMERTLMLDVRLDKWWSEFEGFCEKHDPDYLKNYDLRKYRRQNLQNRYSVYWVTLLVPYTIFITSINTVEGNRNYSCQLFFRNAPLSKLNDMLYKVPFYNITYPQRACIYPRRRDFSGLFAMPKSQIVEELYSIFWESEFNTDYSENVRSYRNHINLRNYFMWEYISKTDPLSILQTKWIRYRSLNSVLASALNANRSRLTGRRNGEPVSFPDIRRVFLGSGG